MKELFLKNAEISRLNADIFRQGCIVAEIKELFFIVSADKKVKVERILKVEEQYLEDLKKCKERKE